MADKPRILNNSKDMIMSLLVLLVLVALVVISSRNCSIGLTGGASDDKTPPFDVHTALRADAGAMPFPVRQPVLPSNWKPNSGTNGRAGDKPISTVGWITPTGFYLGLSQTDAGESALLPSLNPTRDKDGDAGLPDSEAIRVVSSPAEPLTISRVRPGNCSTSRSSRMVRSFSVMLE